MTWAVRGGCIGVAAGLVELAIVTWPALRPQWPWPGMFHVSPHWMWLRPIAVALLGAAIGAAGALLQRFAPSLARDRNICWTIVAVTVFSALLPFQGQVQTVSLLLLSAGLGVPLSWWLSRHTDAATWRPVRRTAAAVVAALAATGAVTVAVPAARESRELAGLTAPTPGAPDILLIVLDTVRLDAIENLPGFARIANGGVGFSRAYATSSWTLETHASLFTGRYPQQVFGAEETPINHETPMPDGIPTLAEVLRDRGYVTAGFVANTNYVSREHGLGRGFVHYDDYPLQAEDILAGTALGNKALKHWAQVRGRPRVIGRRDAGQINHAFLDWFDRRPAGRPVFAFLNYFDAHDPYLPPPEFRSGPPPADANINPYRQYEAAEVTDLRRAYDDCVRSLDDALGRLVTALEERGALDSTVLVVTSDHGEHFWEHDLLAHGNSLYRASIEVPLAVRYPAAVPAAVEVTAEVSLRDVPATILELAGVGGTLLPGVPLTRLWEASPEVPAPSPAVSSLIVGRQPHSWAPANWPVSRGGMRSVVAGGLHYIRNGDGREELYLLDADPLETRDLSAAPAWNGDLKRLRALLQDSERDPVRATTPGPGIR